MNNCSPDCRRSCRVLSIQSHVVSGYVGNKSATFPLQVLGFEVDNINSVQLSNHTGYKHFKGQVLDARELKELFDSLKLNKLHYNYTHLLTGYVGSESFLEEVFTVVQELRSTNPNLIFVLASLLDIFASTEDCVCILVSQLKTKSFESKTESGLLLFACTVCDPVMGDNGQYYVPKELMPIYRDKLLPLADIITPNQFEAEMLTGRMISSEKDAFQAMKILHDRGSKAVVITSSDLGEENMLVLLLSTLSGVRVKLEIPRLDAIFTGTGDLFASLLLAWTHKHPDNLPLACEKTLSTVQTVLRQTIDAARELAGPDRKPTPEQIELRLVQSLDDIRNPEITFRAQEWCQDDIL